LLDIIAGFETLRRSDGVDRVTKRELADQK